MGVAPSTDNAPNFTLSRMIRIKKMLSPEDFFFLCNGRGHRPPPPWQTTDPPLKIGASDFKPLYCRYGVLLCFFPRMLLFHKLLIFFSNSICMISIFCLLQQFHLVWIYFDGCVGANVVLGYTSYVPIFFEWINIMSQKEQKYNNKMASSD